MLLDLLTFTLIPIVSISFLYCFLSLDTTDLESSILLNPSSKSWTVQRMGTCAASSEFKLASNEPHQLPGYCKQNPNILFI